MGKLAQGIIFTLAGAVLWGFSGTAMQFLLEGYHVSTLFVTMVRMLGAGATFLAFMLVRHRQVLARLLAQPAVLGRFAIFGIVGLFVCQITYIVTIDYTNAGTATVLQSASIVMVMVVVCAARHRLPSALEVAGLACAVLAIYLISTGGDFTTLSIPLAGLVIGLVSAASVAFYMLYPRQLFEEFGSVAVTGLGMLFGGVAATVCWIVLAGVGAAAGEEGAVAALAGVASDDFLSADARAALAHALTTIPTLDALGIAMLLVVVFVGTVGAFGLNLHGISLVGGMRASMLGAAEPVAATVLAAVWLGTAFGWADWAGLALMVATIFLVARSGE